MASLWIALQITLVGMGLVFAAILLLWVMMALLVRFTEEELPSRDEATLVRETLSENRELKLRAASAAVAFALAMRKHYGSEGDLHEFPLPPTATVSPWQSVMRTNILNKRGRVR